MSRKKERVTEEIESILNETITVSIGAVMLMGVSGREFGFSWRFIPLFKLRLAADDGACA